MDSSADKEVPHLVASAPGLRLADVLTRATTRSGEMAIDVMVKATITLQGSPNPHLDGLTQKIKKYAEHHDELLAQGIKYAPGFGQRMVVHPTT